MREQNGSLIITKIDEAGLGQGFEALDDRDEFHAVVGGFGVAAAALLDPAGRGVAEQESPAAWAGVAGAGAVGEEFDVGEVGHVSDE